MARPLGFGQEDQLIGDNGEAVGRSDFTSRLDYEFFQACDADSQSTDPLVTGGRLRETPGYFQYQFLYDVHVTVSRMPSADGW
eukprot:Skav220573  [mRNA]  locus=scaffold145:131915:133014:- [translate_table: standard]